MKSSSILKCFLNVFIHCRRRMYVRAKTMTGNKFVVYVTRNDMPSSGIDLLKEECDIKMFNKPSPVPRDIFLKSVAGVQGIFCALTDRIDKELLDAAGPNLKVVSTMSAVYDHINRVECSKRGIKIGYTPLVLTDATAELTMALLLATARRLLEAQLEAKTGGWIEVGPYAPLWMAGPGLTGATVGIVGLDKISLAVIKRVKAFNISRIIYVNRIEEYSAKKDGAIKVTFKELLAESDFIICCVHLVPEKLRYLLPETFFNKTALEKMKPTAIFINTSNGNIVDQSALYDALKRKTIYAAGLDVTTPEPLPVDNPLFKLKNCIILPHIGSATIQTRSIMCEVTAKNILAALHGKAMPDELKLKLRSEKTNNN